METAYCNKEDMSSLLQYAVIIFGIGDWDAQKIIWGVTIVDWKIICVECLLRIKNENNERNIRTIFAISNSDFQPRYTIS